MHGVDPEDEEDVSEEDIAIPGNDSDEDGTEALIHCNNDEQQDQEADGMESMDEVICGNKDQIFAWKSRRLVATLFSCWV